MVALVTSEGFTTMVQPEARMTGTRSAGRSVDHDDSGADDLHGAAHQAVHAARRPGGHRDADCQCDADGDGVREFRGPRSGQPAADQRHPHDQRRRPPDSGQQLDGGTALDHVVVSHGVDRQGFR